MRAISLFAVLVLALPAYTLDDDKEYKPESGSYSLRVPKDWKGGNSPDRDQTQDSMTFTPPAAQGYAIVVSVMSPKMPLAALREGVRSAFKGGSQKPQNETELKVDGRAAWSYELLVEERGRPKVRVRQTLVDAPHCVMIIVAAPDPWPPAFAEEAQRITSSLHVLMKDEAAAPLEFETKELLGGSLKIDLPKEGEAEKETDDSLEVGWKSMGMMFQAECSRTSLSFEEAAAYDLAKEESSEEKEHVEVVDKHAADVAGGKAFVQHAYIVVNGTRVVTVTMLYRSAAKGENTCIGFIRLGEVSFDELKPLEEKLLKADLKPHFAEAAQELPPLSQRVEKALGGPSLCVPKGWVQGKTKKAKNKPDEPQVAGRMKWGAERSMDLGIRIETGTMKGGKEAYQAWWWDKFFKKSEGAKFSEPRAIKVGGQDAVVLEAEHGPDKDRWCRCNVLVWDGEAYVEISTACPVALKKVYGGLAERIAATVEWGK